MPASLQRMTWSGLAWAVLAPAVLGQVLGPVTPLVGLPTAGLPRGARLRLVNGTNPFLAMAVSPDGSRLASGGYERWVQLWDLTTGRELRRWSTSAGNISGLAFSPDGRLLAAGAIDDPVVHVWDVASGRMVHSLSGLPHGLSSVAFSTDGKLVAAGGYRTGDVYLWDAATGKALPPLSGKPVPSPETDGMAQGPPEFSHMAFAPDGKTLVSGHLYGLVRVWDMASRKEVRNFRGPTSDVFLHVACTPGSEQVVCWGSAIRVWQAASGKQLRSFGEQPELRVAALAVAPDGRTVASGSAGKDVGDDTVHLWETRTGRERATLEGHRYAVSAVAFTRDGTTLISGSRDGTALVWDVRRLEGAVAPLSPEDLETAWQELGYEDATRAYHALRLLIAHHRVSVPFLARRVGPVVPVAPARVHDLIAQLESDFFKSRREASEELAMQAEVIEPILKTALAARPSPEVARRLREILRRRAAGECCGRQLQALRALEVLEAVNTSQAIDILQVVGGGSSEFEITRDARTSLGRLRSPPLRGGPEPPRSGGLRQRGGRRSSNDAESDTR